MNIQLFSPGRTAPKSTCTVDINVVPSSTRTNLNLLARPCRRTRTSRNPTARRNAISAPVSPGTVSGVSRVLCAEDTGTNHPKDRWWNRHQTPNADPPTNPHWPCFSPSAMDWCRGDPGTLLVMPRGKLGHASRCGIVVTLW